MGYLLRIIYDFTSIYVWRVLGFLNRHLLKTYLEIEDCGRCRDCGRNVHDFIVPDWLWIRIWGNRGGILCYDCFCNRWDKMSNHRQRMKMIWIYLLPDNYFYKLDDLEKGFF